MPKGKRALVSLAPNIKCSATNKHKFPIISMCDSLAKLVIIWQPQGPRKYHRFLWLEWGKCVSIRWTALLVAAAGIAGTLEPRLSLLFFFLVYLTSPRQHFICVSIDSWQQQCGSADCNKPVFWKQHSCLGSAIVTKWYGSEIGAMISVCALELRKSGTDETWNWNYFNNPGGEIIPSILVEDILECSLLEKGPFYPGCLETGI